MAELFRLVNYDNLLRWDSQHSPNVCGSVDENQRCPGEAFSGDWYYSPLVNERGYGKSPCLIGKLTILMAKMAMFNSYVRLSEGIGTVWLTGSSWIFEQPIHLYFHDGDFGWQIVMTLEVSSSGQLLRVNDIDWTFSKVRSLFSILYPYWCLTLFQCYLRICLQLFTSIFSVGNIHLIMILDNLDAM